METLSADLYNSLYLLQGPPGPRGDDGVPGQPGQPVSGSLMDLHVCRQRCISRNVVAVLGRAWTSWIHWFGW